MDMRVCTNCDENVDISENAMQRTWQQWKCYACGQWNDRLENLTGSNPVYTGPDRCDCGAKTGERHLPACLHAMTGDITQVSKPWDLRDEDGDLHSPAWYLSAFITSERDYHDAFKMSLEGMTDAQEDAHLELLDDLLNETDKYGTYVNRMFGSDMVEGVWDHNHRADGINLKDK